MHNNNLNKSQVPKRLNIIDNVDKIERYEIV